MHSSLKSYSNPEDKLYLCQVFSRDGISHIPGRVVLCMRVSDSLSDDLLYHRLLKRAAESVQSAAQSNAMAAVQWKRRSSQLTDYFELHKIIISTKIVYNTFSLPSAARSSFRAKQQELGARLNLLS